MVGLIVVGALLGNGVGVAVGASVGIPDGAPVGRSDGISVGTSVGTSDGTAVGVVVGTAVGVTVGVAVGPAVGNTVGCKVGTEVGVPVGACVTDTKRSTMCVSETANRDCHPCPDTNRTSCTKYGPGGVVDKNLAVIAIEPKLGNCCNCCPSTPVAPKLKPPEPLAFFTDTTMSTFVSAVAVHSLLIVKAVPWLKFLTTVAGTCKI